MEYTRKNSNIQTQIENAAATAFFDMAMQSNLAYRPQFVYNNPKIGKKVLSVIEDELSSCEEFAMSVAFITMGGITPLLQIFQELERKNIRGRILTTDYLNFSEPRALEHLSKLKNITLKMYRTDEEKQGFHTKGYIFRNDGLYRMILGSSNLTMSALMLNQEWNTRIVSTEQGEFADSMVSEFNRLWNAENTYFYEDFIESYRLRYEMIKSQRKIARSEEIVSIESYRLQPNQMQVKFTSNLQKLRDAGEKRALLISATGTGKTYASAFALRELKAKKVLFLVHREQIAKQAMASFKRVFGETRSFGLLSGNSKELDKDYLFATMQMMAKPEIFSKLKQDEFDVIVIDEAHRTGAVSYQNIMNYFTPEFWLGMTASPERTDHFDVYKLFDHNIAYEIRLQQALEENLLCPFHYFGITDFQINGETVDESTGFRDFNKLAADERVQYILQQADYFGYSGDRVKGLVFCSMKQEAIILSEKFNLRGYRTVALTGEDSQEKRERAVERLVSDKKEEQLDYIFTVDIFNEGVDIPEINQVIMLRPTESPIVFVQQLGRGLRKVSNKEYVVILDFIGNYKNNFMIPIALSGDRSYNKDNIRRYIMEGERIIPGASTIHFDEISRKRIFSAIDTANFNDIRLIKDNYFQLKNKLGRIPSLMDFDECGEMDVLRIFDNPSLGSYHKFLVKYEKEYSTRFSSDEEKVIEFISKKLASGKRVYELELLRKMLIYHHNLLKILRGSLKEEYHLSMNQNLEENLVNVMTNEFPAGTGKKTYESCVFLKKEQSGDYGITPSFEKMLENQDFYETIGQLVDFGIARYKRTYSSRYKNTDFVLYQKYTYEDVCRLLNWKNNEVPLNIGGYKYDRNTRTFPVFINYEKGVEIQDSIRYEDHFLTPDRLIAISKSGRSLESEDVQNFLHARERNIQVELFVRKNKDDKISKEFYYLGHMSATGNTKEFVMENTAKTAVEIEWILETPVQEDLYQYIVNA